MGGLAITGKYKIRSKKPTAPKCLELLSLNEKQAAAMIYPDKTTNNISGYSHIVLQQ